MSVSTPSRPLDTGGAAPLGSHYDGSGASFALFSSVAEAVELCLFDESGEETRWSLEQGEGFVWQGYLPDVRRASATAIACTGRGTRPRVSAATLRSCCSTRTRARLLAR